MRWDGTRTSGLFAPFLLNARTRGSRLLGFGARYAISTLGPVSTSAAHLLASILVFHALPPAEFGLLSFVIVIVSFWLSMSGSLLGAPAAITAASRRQGQWLELPTLLSANIGLSLLAVIAIALLLLAVGSTLPCAILFGFYGGQMSVRWFARGYNYATQKPARAAISDFVYAATLTTGLIFLAAADEITNLHVAIAMIVSASAGLCASGRPFLRDQLAAIRFPTFRGYGKLWRELTRWALLGVVSTELSANAHVYIVTLFCGPRIFALLALGSLLMRPVSLSLSALSDLERPTIASNLAKKNYREAFYITKIFRAAGLSLWLLTLALTAGLLYAAPDFILRGRYNISDAAMVAALWVAIMFVRVWRTPESVLLQASRQFRPLANASVESSVLSLALTLILLQLAGPIGALGGVLISDIYMTARIYYQGRRLRQSLNEAPLEIDPLATQPEPPDENGEENICQTGAVYVPVTIRTA